MKNYILLFILSLFIGCTKHSYNRYIIENDSDYSITIVNYDTTYFLKTDTIFIEKGSFYEDIAEHNYKAIKISNIFHIHSRKTTSDSIKVFFDTLKVLSFYIQLESEQQKRNLLYVKESFEKQNCREPQGCDYYYKITNKDFENATTIKP